MIVNRGADVAGAGGRYLIYRHRLGEGSHHYQCRRFGQRRKRRDHDFQLRVHRR